MKKERLDRVLVGRAIYPTREQAQRAVMAGEVRVGDQIADKRLPRLVVPDSANHFSYDRNY